MWSDIMQLMANFRCVMVISMCVDISYNNVLRIYCCYSMQLATIVSTLVYADMEVNLVISKVIKLLSHSPVNLIYFQFMMS